MKKDVHVIRESIAKVVNLLTHRAIKVTQRGAGARVKYNPYTHEVLGINIPYIPDSATPEFIAAVQGFLDHEVGHVLFTDAKTVAEGVKLGAKTKNLHNLIEDVYVERKMTEAFAGSGHNLELLRRTYLNDICLKGVNAALKDGDTEGAIGFAIVAGFRAWGGQASAQDFLKDNPAVNALIEPLKKRLGPLAAAIGACNSSKDCLDLAQKIRALSIAPPPPPAVEPPPPPPAPPPSPVNKPEKVAPPPQPESEDQPPAEDDEDEDENPSTPAEEPETDQNEPNAGEGDEPENQGKGDILGGDDNDQDEPDPDDADDEPIAPPEDYVPPEDEQDNDTTGAGPAPSGETEPEHDGDTEPGDEPAAGPGTPEDHRGEELPDGFGDTPDEGGAGGGDQQDLSGAFDQDRDFDDAMSNELSKMALKEIKASDYAIFSTEWDAVQPAESTKTPEALKALEDKLSGVVNVMAKNLERAVAAKARKTWNPGQRKGRINPGALHRTQTGDDRIFRTRYETRAKNTAVELLVDCSGSMSGAKVQTAAHASYALLTVLERLKVSCEMVGHTTFSSPEMRAALADDPDEHAYSRHQAILMPIFKSFGERITPEVRGRIANLLTNPSWLGANCDSEALRMASRRLMTQKAERKIIFVLSDGMPACYPGQGLNEHLVETANDLEKAGVEVVGIGILTDAPKKFYKKHVLLKDLADLPTVVMAEITKSLLAD